MDPTTIQNNLAPFPGLVQAYVVFRNSVPDPMLPSTSPPIPAVRIIIMAAIKKRLPADDLVRSQLEGGECPICLHRYDQATETKCGHVFCRNCVLRALEEKTKCPSCVQEYEVKDLTRLEILGEGLWEPQVEEESNGEGDGREEGAGGDEGGA